MIGDAVGLAVVAVEVFVLFHWIMPTGENRIVFMILAYAIAAGLALYLWYNRKIIEIASEPTEWAALASCTILFAAVSFAIDAMVGSTSESKLSLLSAAENVGSPFGFPLTLMLSGVAMATVAGWVRSFFRRASEGDPAFKP
jgi:hypothetical protein